MPCGGVTSRRATPKFPDTRALGATVDRAAAGRFMGGLLLGASERSAAGLGWPASPVDDASVGMERPLGKFLLERMLRDLRLVELDPEAGTFVGPHDPPLGLGDEAFPDHVLAPRNVGVNGFADHVAGLREPELERC